MDSAAVGVPGEETSLLARLTLEQKVRLLTGANAWVLHGEEAIGLRPIVSIARARGSMSCRGQARSPMAAAARVSYGRWRRRRARWALKSCSSIA